MTKKKRKVAKSKKQTTLVTRALTHFKTVRSRALLAGAIVTIVAVPVSWIVVNAQSPKDVSSDYGDSAHASDDAAKAEGGAGAANDGKKPDPSKPTAKPAGDKSGATSTTPTAGSGSGSALAPATQPTPTATPPVTSPTGLHASIKTTIFWVGEAPGPENAGISNAESAWDANWQTHFGGFDDPDHRSGYYPAGFTPSENPFYFALPYNDLNENGDRKSTASNCPNTSSSVSWCKNAWIKVTKGGKVAYAQWEDVGPLKEDDVAYVFGTAAPSNTWGAKAGLDVSPAVRDYLGLSDVDSTSWMFVPASSVPAGPWKNIVTTSPGGW